MIVLDTNILSELMRPKPTSRVTDWVASRPSVEFFTTTITRAEILYGLALLPAGKRREALNDVARDIFNQDLAGRVLPFDSAAADVYAEIAAGRRRGGRAISQFDAQIAAIALSRGADLATRNASDFEDLGLRVHNPWKD